MIAEYIWIDGQKPTAKLRSKTKVIYDFDGSTLPIWGFDGSSTFQAVTDASDCVLKPVRWYKDTTRADNAILVLNEVETIDGKPHPSNTRAELRTIFEAHASEDPLFGIEQEFTFFDGVRPLGWPINGFPAPQGLYYCGIGFDEVFGREIVEDHMHACLEAGIAYEGGHAEVMPAQWEFQIGVCDPLRLADDLWVARWLLYRIAEKYKVSATLSAKPVKGDWNGAGAHTNFSTKSMRSNIDACWAAIKKLEAKHDEHVAIYGEDIEDRLTGLHETCDYRTFKAGVSDRGASIRIPWHVDVNKKGYIEDRRPCANIDPYKVCAKIINTVCS